MKNYDCIVIGTGQAGPILAIALADHGETVAIIEKGALGGACVNEGCTPTKAYVASARRAWVTKNSNDHGITLKGEVNIDLRAIKARKDRIVEDKHRDLHKMLDHDRIELLRGEAKFTDAHTVDVNGQKLRADRIFLNVGGRPRIPDNFKSVNYLTNRSILELEEIPNHLLIVGGGYIGLEFGQMFRRFGSKVTILEQGDRILRKEDADIGMAITDIFKNEGIDVVLNAECMEARQKDGGVEIMYNCHGKEETIQGSHMLLGVGRLPNTDLLNLENAGVKTDERGYITVGNTLKSNVDHIWALGDCNGQGAFTHTAFNDFQIVESQILGDGKRTLDDRYTCYAAFIDPALGRVGMNRAQIKEKGIKAKIAEMPMNQVARSIEKGETQGLMRIYIDAKTDRFLGATFLGAEADEYIHTIIDAMYGDLPYQVLRDAVHIHPTVSELIPTMLESLKDLDG